LVKGAAVRVPVRLFLDFKNRAPDGSGLLILEMEEGATVAAALRQLDISLEAPKVLLLEGRQAQLDLPLSEGLELAVFPPLDGG
jgi:hypothetical protein